MKDIVYIVPLTPDNHLTPLRKLLRDITLLALKNQTSGNWEALLIGEYDKHDGNVIYLPATAPSVDYIKQTRDSAGATDKHFKIDVAMQYIERQEKKPKYVARLDDDDFISPHIVSIIEKSGDNYDCFADKYQALVNVTNGKVCLANLAWMANTVFHKYEHAKTLILEFGFSLINCSHNLGFHKYYAGKNVWHSEKGNPIYLRTLSPTNLSLSTQDKNTFETHVNRYGFWQYKLLPDFEPYLSEFYKEYEILTHTKINRNFSPFYRLQSFISYLLYKRFNNLFPRLLGKLKD